MTGIINTSLLRLCIIAGCVLLSLPSYASHPRTTIAPQEELISDFDARLELARFLSYSPLTIEQALKEYEALVGERPGDVDVRLAMARILIQVGKYDDASVHLRTVMEKRPDDYDVLVTAGDLSLYMGRLGDAESLYRKAFLGKPESKEVRRKLALLLSWQKKDNEALPMLRPLLDASPDDKEAAIELSRIYFRASDAQKAVGIINGMLAIYPDDPDLMRELAGIEASSGHAKRSMELYLTVLSRKSEDWSIRLNYADALNAQGDFYKSEKIFREYLKIHPDSDEILLKLAWTLASAERYEEAGAIHLAMLHEKRSTEKAIVDMIKVKLLEKDFVNAHELSERIVSMNPHDKDGLALKARTLFALKRNEEALALYGKLAGRPDATVEEKAEFLVAKGKIHVRLKEDDNARLCFDEAYAASRHSEAARFYREGFERVYSEEFVKNLIEEKGETSKSLVGWADIYASHGHVREAVALLDAAERRDPLYFPASIGLAQMLAIDRQYDRAVSRMDELASYFPDNYKIMLWRARTLAWAKKYDESIRHYEMVLIHNPEDMVPRKEKARVAVWGKDFPKADLYYRHIYSATVDKKLCNALDESSVDLRSASLKKAVSDLCALSEGGSVYKGYESFSISFDSMKDTLEAGERTAVEKKIIEFSADYRMQKAAYLEREAKTFTWNKRYIHAAYTYGELIDFTPGNEEARFDYAQGECILGVCARERAAYESLLDIDPQHNLAGIALQRRMIRSRPSARFDYSYWSEDGHGDLSRITRNRFDLAVDMPLFCGYQLGLVGHRWLENPWYNHRTYGAAGFTLSLNGTVNRFVKGDVSWTHKAYDYNDVKNRDTGLAQAWFNLKDYARLGAGYERRDEIYNYFGIVQGTQSNVWWASIRSDLTRRLEVEGRIGYLDYNDNNTGQHHFVTAGYSMTDHPKTFKVILSGEYRDTQKTNIYHYAGDILVGITHPYWAPQNYTAAGITFEWRHDYSSIFFCGNESRYYDVKISFGADSDNNPAARIEAELHHEFYKKWTVGIKGLWHSSPKWDAQGIWATLSRRF